MSRVARASVAMMALASILLATAAVGTVGAIGGCSLLSGWSDLQTATKDASPSKTGTGDGGSSGNPGDPGTGDAEPGPDTGTMGTPDGSVGPGSGITCGSNQCAPGEGCCVAFDGPKACATTCDTASGSFFLRCTGAASCDARTPVCCFDYGTQTAICSTVCKPGYPAICDAPPNTCPSGEACTTVVAGTGNIRACQ